MGSDVRFREDLRIFEHENFDITLRKVELVEFERRILKLADVEEENKDETPVITLKQL